MISNTLVIIFIIVIVFIFAFILRSYDKGHKHLIYRVLSFIIFLDHLVDCVDWNEIYFYRRYKSVLYFLDSLTYIGVAFAPAFSLVISLAFVNHYEEIPKGYLLFFIVPFITNIMVWTNPLHHLQYVHFSVVSSEVFLDHIFISQAYIVIYV